MYIIELFFKLKEKLKQSAKKEKPKEPERCEHLFLPIDSTKKILACSKCGMIYKLKDGEVNPFK